jgi:hypothetical protein
MLGTFVPGRRGIGPACAWACSALETGPVNEKTATVASTLADAVITTSELL